VWQVRSSSWIRFPGYFSGSFHFPPSFFIYFPNFTINDNKGRNPSCQVLVVVGSRFSFFCFFAVRALSFFSFLFEPILSLLLTRFTNLHLLTNISTCNYHVCRDSIPLPADVHLLTTPHCLQAPNTRCVPRLDNSNIQKESKQSLARSSRGNLPTNYPLCHHIHIYHACLVALSLFAFSFRYTKGYGAAYSELENFFSLFTFSYLVTAYACMT
jgi:hypothetical protein